MSDPYTKKLKAQLEAYQTAFNQVDDRCEYKQFTREDFKTIADCLTIKLAKAEDEYRSTIQTK